jgi:predicted N-acetyltransferase YhbS
LRSGALSGAEGGGGRGHRVLVRPLAPADVDAADRVMRLAFGTFLGVPDPITVFGDAEMLRSRYAADPAGAFAAELDGEIVGAVYATRWGSYAFFGPLCVSPQLWDRGIGALLLEPVMELFERWAVRQAGLYTFADSAKHVGLYQRFGFWPQQLTAIMARAPQANGASSTYAQAPSGERDGLLAQCRAITDAIFEGLDVSVEITAVAAQAVGDTVLVRSGSQLDGFAVCHCGAGEARSGVCFVKFGAVRPGEGAGQRFEALVGACEALARERGLDLVMAGVNVARHDAYRRLLARGYRTAIQGVVMQRPNEPGYCRRDVYALDDLR